MSNLKKGDIKSHSICYDIAVIPEKGLWHNLSLQIFSFKHKYFFQILDIQPTILAL